MAGERAASAERSTASSNGSVVYYTHNPRPTAALLTSYYRDDADFDDGSGSDPAAKQGAFGAHGLHIYATADTDNTPFGFGFDQGQVATARARAGARF